MPGQFSFMGYPAQVVLKASKLLVPGIERVDVVYYDPSAKGLVAGMIRKHENGYSQHSLEIDTALKVLKKMRRKKTPAEWYEPEEIPYQLQKDTLRSGVFGEINKRVLLVRFPNHYDGENDLSFFYFQNDLSNYLMSGKPGRLTPDMKQVVAKNLRNAIMTILTHAENDRQVLQMISKNFSAAGENLEDLNKKIRDVRMKYEESLVISCKHYLYKAETKYGGKYRFSDAAVMKIREYDGEFHKLEEIINKAVDMVNNLTFSDHTGDRIIMAGHLNFSDISSSERKPDEPELGIYTKAARFLNRLETGLARAKKQNLPPTSKNVSALMDEPVKPPAISYSVNYHQENIKKLFKMYPDKWNGIKTEFKPIMKLVQRNVPSSGESAGQASA
jgi:hypothetical protein